MIHNEHQYKVTKGEIPYSASWGAIKTIRNMGQREDNSGDKRD
jgi:hypothetical protein